MSTPRLSTLFLALIVALSGAGCASYSKLEPGTTLGRIEVSGVRISSRERMVNERLKLREFLDTQLTAAQGLSEKEFAPDGGFSVRSVSGTAAGLGLNLDAGSAKIAQLAKARDAQRLRQQQEIDAKDHELLLAVREKLLAEVKAGKTTPEKAQEILTALKTAEVSGGAPQVVKSPDPTEAAKWRDDTSQLLKTAATLPQAFAPVPGHASPIDLFRDKLALLEEIRSEAARNELDDRHDLYGSTLIRLSVDATLIPEHDTSAWGVVEMKVKPFYETDLFTVEGFVARLNDLAIDRMLRARKQYLKACYGPHLEVDQGRTATNMLGRFSFAERKIYISSPKRKGDKAIKVTYDLINEAIAKMRKSKQSPGFCDSDFEKNYLIPLVQQVFHTEILTTNLTLPGNPSLELYEVFDLKRGEGEAYAFKLRDKAPRDSLQSWLEGAHKMITSLPYAYAATPKEQVQRISESGSRQDAIELMLALQAVSGAGSASGAISMMQANEVIAAALHRQPLVVSYSRTPTSRDDQFRRIGWVLGPRFKVEQDARGRPEFGFRHRIVQNTLNAEVVVPLLASGVEVVTCAGWRSERDPDSAVGGDGECPAGTSMIGRERVYLPQTPEALAETFDPDARRPYPELYARALIPQAVPLDSPASPAAGSGATGRSVLMLQGTNLWRNPQVFVGAIKAREVLVLSDMRGIQATFDMPPASLMDCGADRTVTVVTSTGSVDFGPTGKPCVTGGGTAATPASKAGMSKVSGKK